MKTNTGFFILLLVLFFLPTTSYAQGVPTEQTNPQVITTTNGDSVCKLSNGNTVPCELFAEAEQIISSEGKVKNPRTGEAMCDYKNRAVSCADLGPNGKLKISSIRENIHDIVMYLTINRVAVMTVLLALLALVAGVLINNKTKSKKNSICAKVSLFMLVILNIIFATLFVSIARADVPIAPAPAAAMCTCVTGASQTCVTSTPGTMWMGFNNYTSSSCSESAAYTTYLWPNTPPQFFYQGIETVVGDVSTGNKHEAKGKEITPTLTLPADSIGQDTGVSCERSGGVNATLKYTGKLNYTVQGICLIGMCQYYSKTATNYSCY